MKNLKIILAVILTISIIAVSLNSRADNSTNAPAKPYPLNTCLVCGMKFGSMGEPYVFVYKGQEIKVCDKSEKADIRQRPGQIPEKTRRRRGQIEKINQMSQDSRFQRTQRRAIVLSVALTVSLVFGTGFCFLIFALNSREKAAGNSPPRLISPDHPRQLVNFSLTDRTGRNVTRSELDGKILVVDFLFTSCSLTCPVVNRCMAQIQQLTTNQPDVKLVSLTVDPRDDTVDALEKYGERFGADTNRWLLLTGDKTALYDLIGNSFLAQDLNDPFNYMPGNFVHTDRIALVDAAGNVRGYFDGMRGCSESFCKEFN